MIAPREREADAIARLVALHLDGPDEWQPEHYDTAEAAARVALEWVRRAKVGEYAPTTPAPVKRTRRGGGNRPESPELRQAKEDVKRRSGGRCEIVHVGCTGWVEHVHHRRRRSQGGSDEPGNLLGLCRVGHDFVHANPELSFERGWLLHAAAVNQ